MPTKKDYKPTAIRMYNDMVNDFTQLCNIYDIDKHCIVMIPYLMALGYCKVQDVDDVDMITIVSQVIREDDELPEGSDRVMYYKDALKAVDRALKETTL